MQTELATQSLHPRNAKVRVAMDIVARYHGADAATAAFEEFERMFVKKDLPDVIDEVLVPLPAMSVVVDILAATGLAPSKSEARRLILGGGVSVDGEKITDVAATTNITEYRLFKVGKRKFLRIKAK